MVNQNKNTKKATQKAFEYAMYEMIGSYFNRATCESKLQEENLKLYFMEQGLQKQYQFEDTCIAFAEKVLSKNFPEEAWNKDVTVKFVKNPYCDLTDIYFTSKDYSLRIFGEYTGRKSRIHAECVSNGELLFTIPCSKGNKEECTAA